MSELFLIWVYENLVVKILLLKRKEPKYAGQSLKFFEGHMTSYIFKFKSNNKYACIN
jgi:hypothetical protein